MASYLSQAVRALTGRSIGENVGAVAGSFTPLGPELGAKIGGKATEALDEFSDRGTPDTTQTTNPPPMNRVANTPSPATIERGPGGRTMPNPMLQPAVFRAPAQPMMQQSMITPIRGGAVGTAIGVGATVGAFITDLFSGQPVKLIITRKLKRETQELMELFMNDMNAVAEQLTALKGKEYTPDIVLMILMKKFTNQGPYVTKAAVRKTRQTVRKLSTLRKLEAEICKPTTRRRAAPRASMTKTSIVKA